MATVLFVDDQAALRRAVHVWLERAGHACHSARSVLGARHCFAQHTFDIAFIDLWLGSGDGDGFELYDWIRAHRPALAPHVVFVTGDIVSSAAIADRLARLGRPVLSKPFDLDELLGHVRRLAPADEPRRPRSP